jgi:sodium-dependent dicarboxylate transporter 2/3/5
MADSDSRYAALKYYTKSQLRWLFNTSTFTGNLVISIVATYFFRKLDYGDAVDYVFGLGLLSIGLWITEAIPPFAVGIFIIAALLFGFGTDFLIDETGPVQLYVGTWTSNVIWMLLGGFFLAEGMKIVGLDKKLFFFTVKRFGSNPEKLLLGLMMTTAIASMVMSNTATTAMMISSVIPLVVMMGKDSIYSKALLTGIPAAASVGGVGTIIGSTPNAIAVGALMEKGIVISFVEWMLMGVPIGLSLVYLFWRYLKRNNRLKTISFDIEKLNQNEYKEEKTKDNKTQQRAVIITLSITVLLWITEPLHGIPVAATSAVPIVLLTLTQVITAEQVRSLPWDTLMLVAGGLALGIALVDVGLAEIAMKKVNNIPMHTFFIVVLFSFVGVLLSNVMSNTAASSILVPLGITLSLPYGIATPIIIAITCSCALLLPVSTPSNAIAYATDMLEQKDFRTGGLFFIILGPVVAIAVVFIWTLLVL